MSSVVIMWIVNCWKTFYTSLKSGVTEVWNHVCKQIGIRRVMEC